MLAHATSYQIFSGLTCYGNYNASLPVTSLSADTQITDCTFTFTSVHTHSSGLLYCNLQGDSSQCNVGTQSGSTSTWTCSLDGNGLDYLNKCLANGDCSFDLTCTGNYHIGSCQVDYTCCPVPRACPDTAWTAGLLALGLLGMEMARRRFSPAKLMPAN